MWINRQKSNAALLFQLSDNQITTVQTVLKNGKVYIPVTDITHAMGGESSELDGSDRSVARDIDSGNAYLVPLLAKSTIEEYTDVVSTYKNMYEDDLKDGDIIRIYLGYSTGTEPRSIELYKDIYVSNGGAKLVKCKGGEEEEDEWLDFLKDRSNIYDYASNGYMEDLGEHRIATILPIYPDAKTVRYKLWTVDGFILEDINQESGVGILNTYNAVDHLCKLAYYMYDEEWKSVITKNGEILYTGKRLISSSFCPVDINSIPDEAGIPKGGNLVIRHQEGTHGFISNLEFGKATYLTPPVDTNRDIVFSKFPTDDTDGFTIILVYEVDVLDSCNFSIDDLIGVLYANFGQEFTYHKWENQ